MLYGRCALVDYSRGPLAVMIHGSLFDRALLAFKGVSLWLLGHLFLDFWKAGVSIGQTSIFQGLCLKFRVSLA